MDLEAFKMYILNSKVTINILKKKWYVKRREKFEIYEILNQNQKIQKLGITQNVMDRKQLEIEQILTQIYQFALSLTYLTEPIKRQIDRVD